MILKMVHLENYAGIMNGMGLEEITIDFTKCTHNMVIIKGDNGAGKSTLFKALKPLPDDNSSFIPYKKARKVIEYFDEFGVIYSFEFIHEVKADGTRLPAKGYVKKSTGHGMTELNPSGNITSCRDIIFDQLKLDPNFVALSQLSTEDRGLADKKPAERKKFVSSIISSVDAYNDIYKILNKKSSVMKNMINSITSKIDTIGNVEALKSTLAGLEAEIAGLQAIVNDANANGIAANSKIKILDPDGSIMTSYEAINKKREETRAEIVAAKAAIGQRFVDASSVIDFQSKVDDIKLSLIQDQTKLNDIQSKISLLNETKNRYASELQAKEVKLESYGSEEDEKKLNNAIHDVNATIIECETFFREIEVDVNNILSKDEYITGINILKDIQETFNSIFSTYDISTISRAICYIREHEMPDIESVKDEIKSKKIELDDIEAQIKQYHEYEKKIEDAANRPKNCKIDTCPYIADAVQAAIALKNEPLCNITSIGRDQAELKLKISNLENYVQELEKTTDLIYSINRILRSIQSSKAVLSKLPISDILLDVGTFLDRIESRDPLYEIDILTKYVEKANLFEDYKAAQALAIDLKHQYDLFNSKKSIIISLEKEIKELKDNIRDIIEKISINTAEESRLINKIADDKKALIENESLLKKSIEINDLICKLGELDMKKSKYNDDIEEIQRCTELMSKAYTDRDIYQDKLNTKLSERDTIKYKLNMTEEYTKELEQYQSKYDKIETIKFFASPTTGIQTLFMDLYMNKVISLANQMLQLMFAGVYHLDQFIINENEFRIPCSGSNLPHDDISSMSSSQIACISMILSFALLFQSSTKLNILKLDEIDGALDSSNRRNFILMLEKMLAILDCDQCVIISHNDELNLDNCDVILLKHSNIEQVNGNIIWQYN